MYNIHETHSVDAIIIQMINLEKYLQSELSKLDVLFPIKISVSAFPEYDYQTSIYKLVENGEKDNLENFVKGNENITNIFNYSFSSSGKQHFLCFKVKNDYLVLILKDFFDTKNIRSVFEMKSKKVLYDYSSPNLAKDMHVGHLRSTIIGDTLANISEYFGNTVSRVNHIGDFGLPFGMIVEYVIQNNIGINETTSLQKLYILSKRQFESDENFKNNSYIRTAELQMETNEQVVKIWKQIYEHSLKSYQEIYDLLTISKDLKITGESFYVKYINEVKDLLKEKGFLENDDKGRTMVKINGMIPMTYEKSQEKGSAYTYDTTDIVTLWYRTQVLNQDEIYYVVDSGQSLHFKQLIQLGKQMGWTNGKKVEHINFGVIKGTHGFRIKSRDGNTPKLLDLVNDGIEVTKESTKSLTENSVVFNSTVSDLAIGSIKYFDLSRMRTADYLFDFDLMLKKDANTYTYLSYSLVRCKGILDKFEKANLILDDIDYSKLEELDFNLLRKLTEFPLILEKVLMTNMPHYLCDYLNNLCTMFHYAYTNTRCMNFDEDNKLINCNYARILLYILISDVLKQSCKLLGLPVINKL